MLGSFKAEKHYFWVRADTHGWTPSSSTASRVYLQSVQMIQCVGESSVDSFHKEVKRKKLAIVRVAGKLQRNPFFGGDRYMIRRMGKKNTRALAVDADFVQHGAKMFCVRRVVIPNADHLESVDFNLIPIQHSNPGP